MPLRRTFLKSAGAVAGLGTVNTVAAEEKSVSAAEAGVEKWYLELLKKGEIKKAKKVLEEHNVNYVSESSTIAAHDSDVEGGDQNKRTRRDHVLGEDQENETVSGQNTTYSEAESDLDITLVQVYSGQDIWWATGTVDLRGKVSTFRNSHWIEDGCGIIFDHDDWSAVNPSKAGVWYLSNGEHEIQHEEYNPNYGVAASVDPAYPRDPDKDEDDYVLMRTELKRTEDNAQAIQFHYEHTNSFSPRSASIGICYGGLCVDLPAEGNTAWRKELIARP